MKWEAAKLVLQDWALLTWRQCIGYHRYPLSAENCPSLSSLLSKHGTYFIDMTSTLGLSIPIEQLSEYNLQTKNQRTWRFGRRFLVKFVENVCAVCIVNVRCPIVEPASQFFFYNWVKTNMDKTAQNFPPNLSSWQLPLCISQSKRNAKILPLKWRLFYSVWKGKLL